MFSSDVRNEQERAYQKMIEDENKKAEEKKRKMDEEMLVLKKEMSTQRRRAKEIEDVVDQLYNTPVPKTGDIITIALKMPKGERLTRVFLKSEPVNVVSC